MVIRCSVTAATSCCFCSSRGMPISSAVAPRSCTLWAEWTTRGMISFAHLTASSPISVGVCSIKLNWKNKYKHWSSLAGSILLTRSDSLSIIDKCSNSTLDLEEAILNNFRTSHFNGLLNCNADRLFQPPQKQNKLTFTAVLSMPSVFFKHMSWT